MNERISRLGERAFDGVSLAEAAFGFKMVA
jgi:hypothetical protein